MVRLTRLEGLSRRFTISGMAPHAQIIWAGLGIQTQVPQAHTRSFLFDRKRHIASQLRKGGFRAQGFLGFSVKPSNSLSTQQPGLVGGLTCASGLFSGLRSSTSGGMAPASRMRILLLSLKARLPRAPAPASFPASVPFLTRSTSGGIAPASRNQYLQRLVAIAASSQ